MSKLVVVDGFNGETTVHDDMADVRQHIEDQTHDYVDDTWGMKQFRESLKVYEVGREIPVEIKTQKITVVLDGEEKGEPTAAEIIAANPPLGRESAKQYAARVGACG
jgi:hypothetical protein